MAQIKRLNLGLVFLFGIILYPIKDFPLARRAFGISTWRMSTLPRKTIKYRFSRGPDKGGGKCF